MIDEDEDFESTSGDAPQPSPGNDRRYAGVRALWMKVIIRAVFDWVTYRDSTKVDKKKYAESAHDWLFQRSLLFNSFENVCRHLDIDAERVRTHARRMTKDDVAKIEHMERDYDSEEPAESAKLAPKTVRVSYRRLTSVAPERVTNGVS